MATIEPYETKDGATLYAVRYRKPDNKQTWKRGFTTKRKAQMFAEQVEVFRELLATAPPEATQQKDIDFLLAGGELFALVVYAQLILENARLYGVEPALVDQIFVVFVRDVSRYAVELLLRRASSPQQMEFARRMIRRPVDDAERYGRVWREMVLPLKDGYEMPA